MDMLLTPDLRRRLLDTLQRVPAFGSRNGRNLLLQNIPPNLVALISRDEAIVADLNQIVTALEGFGTLDTGQTALATMIKDAANEVKGSELSVELRQILDSPALLARSVATQKTDQIPLRTLYLSALFSVNGHNYLRGRQLYDEFSTLSEACRLRHCVVTNEDAPNFEGPQSSNDVMSYSELKEFNPNLIYLEGGLFLYGQGTWRIPRPIAEELVRAGAVMIIADANTNDLDWHKPHYKEAGTFLQAYADYGERDEQHPVCGVDRLGNRTLVCEPTKMVVSEWLRPIYKDILAVTVSLSVRLASWRELLASSNADNSGTLQDDLWVERSESFPFASVTALGLGYVVFIAGSVSHDVFLQSCPDNGKWLTNVGQFLVDEAARDRSRRL